MTVATKTVSKTAAKKLNAAADARALAARAAETGEKPAAKPSAKPAADAAPADPKAPKVSAGDAAIGRCATVGATNAQLLKAIWSTRGNVYAQVPGFEFGLAIVKSNLVATLQALPAADACGFVLTPRPGTDSDRGADLAVSK